MQGDNGGSNCNDIIIMIAWHVDINGNYSN